MLTWVEINSRAFKKNLLALKKAIGDEVELMPVIKANAYGHGLIEMARLCQSDLSVGRLCVVSLDEAAELIQNKLTKKPIFILDIFDLDDEAKIILAIKNSVQFPVFTIEQAMVLNRAGEISSKKVKIHLKIDTGTARVGVKPSDAINFVKKMRQFSHLSLAGLWGHFSSSESNHTTTKAQWQSFEEVNTKFVQEGINLPFRHMACSAATILHPMTRANGVRVGLAIYGLYPEKKLVNRIKLSPVLSWHTTIIQVKMLSIGSPIGYGGSYVTKRKTKLAILPVGYADGYDRSLGNSSFVLVRGKRCPVRGRICMNLMMIDVTDVPNVKSGDKATLLGKNGKEAVPAEELAAIADTINYEIVARINPRIKRIVI